MAKTTTTAKADKEKAAQLAEFIANASDKLGISTAELSRLMELPPAKLSESEIESAIHRPYGKGESPCPNENRFRKIGQPKKSDLYPQRKGGHA